MSNKLFPVCVIDDFYTNPYDVRELALSQKFYPNTDGRWPGARSKSIDYIDSYLYQHFTAKILAVFYNLNEIRGYKIDTFFQKVKPFHYDKNNKNNRGFIHQDYTLFGGVIYLDPNPDENSGTSIYNFKHKWHSRNDLDDCANDVKFKKYLGNELTDKDIRKWDESRDQYAETVKVENVFNRCILFDGNTFHGVPCFGSKERLTQVFFVENINFSSDKSPKYPLIKSSI